MFNISGLQYAWSFMPGYRLVAGDSMRFSVDIGGATVQLDGDIIRVNAGARPGVRWG